MAQNVLDTDSFGGSNGTALHTYNSNWVILDATNISEVLIAGTPGIGGPGACGDLRNGFTWTNDQWSELKIDGTNLADYAFLVCVRATAGSGNNCTGYAAGAHRDLTGGTYQIYSFTAPGAFTALATGAHSYTQNDVVNLQIVGLILTLTVNGVTETTYDTTPDGVKYSSGSPALVIGSQATRLAGSWRAGSVGGGDTQEWIGSYPLVHGTGGMVGY